MIRRRCMHILSACRAEFVPPTLECSEAAMSWRTKANVQTVARVLGTVCRVSRRAQELRQKFILELGISIAL